MIIKILCFSRWCGTAAAKSLQSCPTLCDPIDGSPPGSPPLGFSRQEPWSGLPFPSPMHACLAINRPKLKRQETGRYKVTTISVSLGTN